MPSTVGTWSVDGGCFTAFRPPDVALFPGYWLPLRKGQTRRIFDEAERREEVDGVNGENGDAAVFWKSRPVTAHFKIIVTIIELPNLVVPGLYLIDPRTIMMP